jgi:hypothetical protein
MKRRALSLLVFAFALALAPTLAAKPSSASSEAAAAQALFYEARALMQKGSYREACPKLEESLRLAPGLGTQFNLADCNEHLGKIATAWVSFLDVAAQAKATNQPTRETVAQKRAAALEARVPRLVVDVIEPPEGLELTHDGVVVGAAAWGTAVPVDPGSHTVAASAPGKRPWTTTVAAAEGEIARVEVPELLSAAPIVATSPTGRNGDEGAPSPVASGATTTTTSSKPDRATSFPPAVVERAGSPQRTIGWIVIGIGIVGVGVGAGFGLASIGKRDESRSYCVGDACDATGVALRDDAIRNGNIATVATLAGGAVVAGGLILALTAPKTTETRVGTVRAVPNVAVGGGGVTLQGRFW